MHERAGRQHRRARPLNARRELGEIGGRWHAEDGVAASAQHHEQVVLAPHDALRHARRPAGVEEHQVVARPAPRREGPVVTSRHDVVVGDGPCRRRLTVGHDVPTTDPGKTVTHLLDERGERRVEHDRLGVGIVEEVRDLVGPVAVVGVERRQARLEGGHVRLEVLGTVVEVGAHLGLPSQTRLEQVGGQGVRPSVEVGPADDTVALHLARRVRNALCDGLVHVGEVPIPHGGKTYRSYLVPVRSTALAPQAPAC